MRKSIIVLAVLAIATSGCASLEIGSSFRPIIDSQTLNGRTNADIAKDLADCQQYARGSNSGQKVAALSIVGALLGAALGATGGNRHMAGQVATYGAIAGTAHGGGAAIATDEAIVRRCMQGRGYSVLN